MRALPVGWAIPLDDPDRRRRLVIELTRATHPDPDVHGRGVRLMGVEGASSRLLLDIAIDEKTQARSACEASDRLGVMLASLAAASGTSTSYSRSWGTTGTYTYECRQCTVLPLVSLYQEQPRESLNG